MHQQQQQQRSREGRGGEGGGKDDGITVRPPCAHFIAHFGAPAAGVSASTRLGQPTREAGR